MTIEQKSGCVPTTNVRKPEVKVGEIVELKLSPELEAEIDRQVALAMEPELEELKKMRKHGNNINPRTFHQPMTY